MNLYDRIKGCVFGGAIGDAFGSPVENYTLNEIHQIYGPHGICDFHANAHTGKNNISDDTQMTLFTLEALYLEHDIEKLPIALYRSYLRWFDTQYGPGAIAPDIADEGKLHKHQEMFTMRCPGHACIDSLRSGQMGTIEQPINISKGNGCIMRVAPIGFLIYEKPATIFKLGQISAAITHGDKIAQECAGLCALLIYFILKDNNNIYEALYQASKFLQLKQNINSEMFEICQLSCWSINEQFPSRIRAKYRKDCWLAKEALGLAISYFTTWRPKTTSFKDRLIDIVNMDEDSDTVASIFGNFWGAQYGMNFNLNYSNLELKDIIIDMVDEFYNSVISPKYICCLGS